jgi:site-specific DNA recombinase
MNKIIKAAFYARTATGENLESIARQLEACTKKLYVEYGVSSGSGFWDLGYSGLDLHRPGLNSLLAAARAGQVNVIVTYGPDRLARDPVLVCDLLDEFKQAGADVVYCGELA